MTGLYALTQSIYGSPHTRFGLLVLLQMRQRLTKYRFLWPISQHGAPLAEVTLRFGKRSVADEPGPAVRECK
ncbi:hypothetical protein BFC17_10130 [Alteromonas lipolytica]|uniref:Uncharacterized protein n=1 Tax=Alteromonas lipolytica TaxID=1856405 RepID=A0A1E8FJU7_9ALTE|nr:hypothetical protein BFC17_10130 [Alteromonas lipolytica]